MCCKLRSYFVLWLQWFIGGLIPAVPGYILVFSILPHYIRYTEPKPFIDSLLQGLVWASLFAVVMSVTQMRKGRKRVDC